MSRREEKAVSLGVPSKDPESKEDKEKAAKEKEDKLKEEKKKKQKEEEDMSEEDKKKKEEMELLVERVQDKDVGVMKAALDMMARELRSATSSMTSVPKPLKFLRPHLETLMKHYEKLPDSTHKKYLADVLSVLATTQPKEARLSLKYRLAGTSFTATSWGHEYVRSLSGEVAAEYHDRQEKGVERAQELLVLVDEIVPFLIKGHSEPDAIDLLCEVERVTEILKYADSGNAQRISLYLMQLAQYGASRDEMEKLLGICFQIYFKENEAPDALRVALRLGSATMMQQVFDSCSDEVVRKQLALMIQRHRGAWGEEFDMTFGGDETLQKLASGETLTTHFAYLAKELDVLEPRNPEDVYKTHLEEKRGGASTVLDSAKQNLASTFVNAFVNAGFCKDNLMLKAEGAGATSGWLYKNKEHGMTSAAASLGALLLWNIEEGLTQIDKFQYSNQTEVKAGALMAFGLVSAGVRSEVDPAFALLSEQLESTNAQLKIAAVVGLGFAYGGTRRQDLLESLTPIVLDVSLSVEVSALAALSLGLVFVGSCNEEAVQAILQALMEREAPALNGPLPTLYGAALGLLFLQKAEACEPTLEALVAIEHHLGKTAGVMVEGLAYACSGDVLKVQKMLHLCAERHDDETESDEEKHLYQAVATIAVPLIALGEEVGSEMALRALDRMLQYGDLNVKRAIPLALSLQSVSNPKPPVIDTLSKLSHDADADVALHAILGLGLIGAGTNNSRIAGLLRQLAAYYTKDANALFTVRIAQGLLYVGKGLVTLSPLHSDRLLINPVALGSLVSVLIVCLNLRTTILAKHHYLLYHLIPALYPRMLVTVDADLTPLPVTVRVGQAVDTVGQAGRPKTITGFQTHTTPVLLAATDRAELASEEYLACTSVLEGVVILRPNPDFKPATKA